MKILQKHLENIINDPLTSEVFTEDSIFFDIETTGFSPSRSQLYLIGCATLCGNQVIIDQFFAEDMGQEENILLAFLDKLKKYKTIITYNGIGFDIPFLKGKCAQFEIEDPFSTFDYLDIYKSVSKYKQIFCLENYKQKSIEQFLDINREDLYTGGELIEVYQKYGKDPDDELSSLLLLHNYEDVLGMIDLLPILSYERFFTQKNFNVTSSCLNDCRNYDGSNGKELLISVSPDYAIPKDLSFHFGPVYISMHKDVIQIVISLYSGTLKHFFSNYKDYYYLPKEDTAMHKSVAAYVDKDYRTQAKASTCYVKKAGLFLIQFDQTFTSPVFYNQYNDKISYFEYDDSLLQDVDKQNKYIQLILHTCTDSNKKTLKQYV